MNIKHTQSYIIILAFALISGCANQQIENTSGNESTAMVPVAVNQNEAPGDQGNEATSMVSQVDKSELLKGETTIYFDFDSSHLNDKAKNSLAAHIQFLKAHPWMSITIEGFADDRGTDDYNMILGEKRAESIKQIMLSENVSANSIKLISYGESRPAMPGHSQVARSHNRRATLLYHTSRENVASN